MPHSRQILNMLVLLGALIATPAHAIMAGSPTGTPADTPALRVDPNVASSPWAGVGVLEVGGKSFSAALIGPRHVLTAAHVVGGAGAGSLSFVLNAGGDASHRLAARAVYVNPGYQGFVPAADGVVHDDLAIVELSEAAPADIPYYVPHVDAPAAGTALTFVGYGATGDGVSGIAGGSAPYTKRVGANAADVLIPDDDGSGRAEVFVFDFDGPDASTNRMGGTTLGNAVETTFGSGDSGSPALLLVGGQWRLAGVGTFVAQFSGGPTQAGVFGTGGGGMLVSGYADWISGVVGAAAPIPEPAPSALWMPGLALVAALSIRRRATKLP